MTETGVPDGSLARAVGELTVGMAQGVDRLARNAHDNQLNEIEQQFQVAISGVAGSMPSFSVVTVNFTYALHYAPAQRDSNLGYPQFTYGSHTKPAVGIHATVEEWLVNKRNGSVVGAIVQIGAVGEGAFKGFAHLSFQGFGAPIVEDELEE